MNRYILQNYESSQLTGNELARVSAHDKMRCSKDYKKSEYNRMAVQMIVRWLVDNT